MRLQSVTSATQPNVPPTQPVVIQTKPSFKGSDEEASDEWKKNKSDFQALYDDPENPSFVKKFAKAMTVVATGVLAYGASKYGIRKSMELVKNMLTSKPIKDATAKVTNFAKGTVIPEAKNIAEAVSQKVKSTKLFGKEGKIAKFVGKMLASIGTKFASLSEKFVAFTKKEKVAKVIKFIKAPFVKVKQLIKDFVAFVKSKTPAKIKTKIADIETAIETKATNFKDKVKSKKPTRRQLLKSIATIKSKMPTAEQVKNGFVEGTAIVSATAASITAGGVASNNEEA